MCRKKQQNQQAKCVFFRLFYGLSCFIDSFLLQRINVATHRTIATRLEFICSFTHCLGFCNSHFPLDSLSEREAKLAVDREARARTAKSAKSAAAASSPSASASASAPASASGCAIQIRLPSGKSARENFHASSTLANVFTWLQTVRDDGKQTEFTLLQRFPHCEFGSNSIVDAAKTVAEAGIVSLKRSAASSLLHFLSCLLLLLMFCCCWLRLRSSRFARHASWRCGNEARIWRWSATRHTQLNLHIEPDSSLALSPLPLSLSLSFALCSNSSWSLSGAIHFFLATAAATRNQLIPTHSGRTHIQSSFPFLLPRSFPFVLPHSSSFLIFTLSLLFLFSSGHAQILYGKLTSAAHVASLNKTAFDSRKEHWVSDAAERVDEEKE